MQDIAYKQKYLKYKAKYLELKMVGGEKLATYIAILNKFNKIRNTVPPNKLYYSRFNKEIDDFENVEIIAIEEKTSPKGTKFLDIRFQLGNDVIILNANTFQTFEANYRVQIVIINNFYVLQECPNRICVENEKLDLKKKE
jgi:hypothetical protein